MAILKPDNTTTLCGVTVNEFLLTKHNPNHIDMPSVSMEGKVIGITAVSYTHLDVYKRQSIP